MSTKDLTALSDLQAAEVSLVKRGANQKKRFPMFKEEQMADDQQEILKAVLETESEGEKELVEYLQVEKASDKGVSAAKSALRILQAFKDEMPGQILAQLAKIAGLEKAQDEKPEDEEDEEMTEKKVKKTEEVQPEVSEEAQKIFKAQAEQIEALQKQNEEVTKALTEEKDKRELEAWIAKAENELSHYPGKSFEDMGKLLKSLSDANPEMAKEQFDNMKTASDALKESEIFKEIGGRSASKDSKSAWAEIERLADGLVEKSSDINYTKEDAVSKVLETERGSKLYQKYLDENPQQCRSFV